MEPRSLYLHSLEDLAYYSPKQDDRVRQHVANINNYVHSLEEFKRIIEREAALKLKYKVVEPYSNYPVEDSVELFYMELESGIKGKRLKLPYSPIRELYMRDIERYKRQGHDWDYSCGEGGTGEWKYTFNQVKFNSQVINNTQIVNDYIELNLDVKLKLL